MRAGERELHAGGQRGVEVVVVGGADDVADLREYGHHARWRRGCGGQEAQLVTLLFVRAVGDQAVTVILDSRSATA